MPYTKKQLDFFRVAMNDKNRSPKERARYRKMYYEGKKLPVKAAKKRGSHGRKSS